jgi:hypothetical protein
MAKMMEKNMATEKDMKAMQEKMNEMNKEMSGMEMEK